MTRFVRKKYFGKAVIPEGEPAADIAWLVV